MILIKDPKVSVIMACHNAAPFINLAIDSVINQTFYDLELIIVDDASSDDSLSIMKKASNKDSRIKIVSLASNIGAAAARNIAIKKAKGEWLAILDADDIFLINKIESQLGLLTRRNSNAVLIGSNSFEIDEKGNRLSLQRYYFRSKTVKKNLVQLKRFPPHSSLMYKTNVVQSLGGFNPRCYRSEDYDLWLRLLRYGGFLLDSNPLVEYRHHGSNISKTNFGFEQIKYSIAIATCHFIREEGLPDPSKDYSTDEWNSFLSWIFIHVEKAGLLEYSRERERWLDLIQKRKYFLSKSLKLLSLVIINFNFFCKVVEKKIFGEGLPRRLSSKWINKDIT
jgi:glycosyltransferase involved in cell wall biosynthesis